MKLALLIEYDGTNYAGWQNQPRRSTVQQAVEQSVESIFGAAISVVGSGRTDAGVHASGQVAHATLPLHANTIPEHKVAIALNTRLPRDIRVIDASYTTPEFHARYDAIQREYEYHIARRPSVFNRRFAWTPELPFRDDLLVECSEVFVGVHDFTTFSKLNKDTESYVCNVERCHVACDASNVMITICADRFVYGMCRSIIGAMMSVGRGRRTTAEIKQALEGKDRLLQEVLVPPQGLNLKKVTYPTSIFSSQA